MKVNLTQDGKRHLLDLLDQELQYFDESNEVHGDLQVLRDKIDNSMSKSE